jgi:hypothetical protein
MSMEFLGWIINYLRNKDSKIILCGRPTVRTASGSVITADCSKGTRIDYED